MQLLMQSYDPIEMQRVRAELERRHIGVHVSDEFTYAIPGMPGAEQPRGIWVAEEDLRPARIVVADLLGKERVATDNSQALPGLVSFGQDDARAPKNGPDKVVPQTQNQLGTGPTRWAWIAIGLAILFVIATSLNRYLYGSSGKPSPASQLQPVDQQPAV